MANLGTLTMDLVAKIGGFIAGLDKAERATAKSAKEIEASMKSISVAGVAVGTAFGELLADGIIAAANAIPQLINNAAKFQDLAEMTGGSAEGLASMAVAAGTAGVSMESVAAASNKLTKNLVGVDDESKDTGAAIKALNIELDTFKRLSPEERVDTLTKAFASFADGTGKTAVSMALWGKSGAEQLKLMKALEEQGGRSNILTNEQIKAADDFADRSAKLRAELGLYASGIVAETLPALNELIKHTLLAGKEIFGLSGEASALGKNNGVRDFAQNAAVAISGFIDGVGNAVLAVGTLINAAKLIGSSSRLAVEAAATPFSGIANVIRGKGYFDGVKNAYAENQEQYDKLSKSFTSVLDRSKAREGKSLRELFDQQNEIAKDKRNLFSAKDPRRLDAKPELVFEGGVKPDKPPKPPKQPKAGGGGAVDDDTKNLLANELKALEDTIAKERDLMASRNKFLDLYNSQGLISVKDYYQQRQTILDDAVASQSAAYDAEIAALQNYLSKAPKATDRASTQGKINEVLEKQAKLHRDAGLAGIEAGIKQTQAQEQVQAAVEEVNAKILEFTGNLSAAAAIRFDAQNKTIKNSFNAEDNKVALQNLATLRAYTLAQADLTKIQQQFSLAQGDLQIAEERITIARERGTMGEIESLRASGVARQQAVALMEKQLALFLSIDAAARSPDQVQAIERLKVQLEGLKATIDPLADKFNTMFSDAAGSAFTDFINGTKTAKEAFKSFIDSIFKQLTDLIVKDLFKQLFSSSGGGTGFNVGKMLSDFFGSASGGGMFGAANGATAQPAKAAGGEDVLGAFISKLGTGDAAATSAAASSTALATSATAATAAISAMATAATATAASISASGATSLGGVISDTAKSAAEKSANASGGDDILGSFIGELGAAGSSVAASNAALVASTTAATTAITALAAAATATATAMAAAAAASSSSSLGSLASSLFSANAVGSSGGDALGALIKLQGWQSGGYTGQGAANEPAGFVHKREFVLNEPTTTRLGVASLNRMNRGGSAGFSQVNNFAVQGQIDHRTVFANAVDSGLNIGKMLAGIFGVASGGIAAAAKAVAETSAKSAGRENVLGTFIGKIGIGDAATAFAARLSAATTAIGALVAAATTISSSALARSPMSSANAIGAPGGHALDELLKLRGWSSGGFTGMGAANDPAGIVHKGEYVLDANTTKRLGVNYLDGINSGGSTGGTNVVINQQFAAGTSRETTNQAALAASRVISRSQRNA